MPPVFIPGGRVFDEGPTHGFASWPGGQTVFGRVRGQGYSHWDGVSGMGMRNLPPSPAYNGCACPQDHYLYCVTGFLNTFVLGVTTGGTGCCAPCDVFADPSCHCTCPPSPCADCYDGNPFHPRPVCAPCDALAGGASEFQNTVKGNVRQFPLSGILGYYEMEALGFTVHDWDSQSMPAEGFWFTSVVGPFTGPDGVTFPHNGGGAGTSGFSNVGGGFWWMEAYYNSGDSTALYVMVMGGGYSTLPSQDVPGWTPEMTTNGIGGLIQVWSQAAVTPPPPPKIAFGHAANCNAYPPIAWGSGSFSAPGNGLLVGDPLAGVIPS